ncbi:MAG: ABC transporter ATP-binding protein [Clostridium sp.]|nr:ABC transporter ATP-binding protein [Clostridium sp.]
MISMNKLSKQLGTFRLQDISFQLPAGYICGLVGQNGAGKTTLLHLLLGLYGADEGQIIINGLTYAQDEKHIHDMTGTVLTEELFEPYHSIEKNADYFGKYFSKYSRERFCEYLEQFRLNGRQKFGELSRGEKLKCQFAFALSYDPLLLLLDEPAGNFDPDFREDFFRILKEFIADGKKSVILATHLTEDLDRLADYLIYLDKGRQVFAGDIESFRQKYRIVSGEKYKMNTLSKDRIVYVEERRYGAKALVKHSSYRQYDDALQVTYPSIEEFMYFYSKGGDQP